MVLADTTRRWATGKLMTGRHTLTRLLAPQTVEMFLAEHWGRQSLHIPGPADRFTDLGITSAAIERAIRTQSLRDEMQLRFVGTDDRVDDRPPDLENYSIHRSAHTLCIDRIEQQFHTLREYCVAIKATLAHCGAVFMSCYASPIEQGFTTHWDCQSSFVLQLEGVKRWRFSPRPALPWPPAVVTGPRGMSEFREHYPWAAVDFPTSGAPSNFEEAILTPGDVLYIPAGAWHAATALDGHSLALTMACMPYTSADLVDDAVRGMLSADSRWRASLPPVDANSSLPDRLPDSVRQFLNARLLELRSCVDELTADDLYETWLHHVSANDVQLAPLRPERNVVPSDVLVKADDLPIRWVAHADGLSLYHLDYRIEIDAAAIPLVQRILEAGPAPAGTLAAALGDYSWDEAAKLFDGLIAGAVLRIDGTAPVA